MLFTVNSHESDQFGRNRRWNPPTIKTLNNLQPFLMKHFLKTANDSKKMQPKNTAGSNFVFELKLLIYKSLWLFLNLSGLGEVFDVRMFRKW